MSKCPICNKEVANWEHPKHTNSKQHQDAGKKAKEITTDMLEEFYDYSDGTGPEVLEDEEKKLPTLFDIMAENFEQLCKEKVIIGAVRVRVFSYLVIDILQSHISEKDIITLKKLRYKWF